MQVLQVSGAVVILRDALALLQYLCFQVEREHTKRNKIND